MSWLEITVQIVLFSLTFCSVVYFRQPNKKKYVTLEEEEEEAKTRRTFRLENDICLQEESVIKKYAPSYNFCDCKVCCCFNFKEKTTTLTEKQLQLEKQQSLIRGGSRVEKKNKSNNNRGKVNAARVEREIDRKELINQLSAYKFP
ncbi:hypothetical protein ABK040_001336 [Willaertia magna]